jgi:deoxycytidylate deaminase
MSVFCHNCAKHIVAAGIRRVVYIEAYPKSKAADLHEDSIKIGFSGNGSGNQSSGEKVQFESFVGVAVPVADVFA